MIHWPSYLYIYPSWTDILAYYTDRITVVTLGLVLCLVLLLDISDGDVAMSAFCSLCFLYLLVLVRLLVIPLLIYGFGFFVVPVVVHLVHFVVTTHTVWAQTTK
jgi:hypothetical protein